MDESKTMQELHKVRRQLYEEQKSLTPAQLVAKIRTEANAAAKKLGVKWRKVKRAA